MDAKTTESQRFIYLEKAHLTKDIRPLIQPWLTFRLYVHFKSSKEYSQSARCHFYGHEHQCTYNQCLHGKVKNIQLDRLAGYASLVKLIEKGAYKGKYITAKIYSREAGETDFNVLHREYYQGKLNMDTVNDPEIDSSDQFRTLYYKVVHNRLQVADIPFDELLSSNL